MFKKLFQPTDMTVGTPWKAIAIFSIPMIIGNVAQQLYSTVDSIVVGHYIGDNALAAVGSAGPLMNMLIALFIGVSAGASIMVSQFFGARQREDLSRTIGNCITLCAMISLILMTCAPLIIRPALRLLNTPESILEDCALYLIVTMVGIAGMAYYNILSGILRGLGDSFSALIYLLVATVINIILDVYFVAVVGMGVYGVALATAIAQGVSALLCFWKLAHMTTLFDLKLHHLKLTRRHAVRIFKLGLPSGITQMIFSSAMIVVQSLTNCFGEMLIAANVIVMRVDGFAMMPNMSFGTAMTTYAGQNVGAQRYDRVGLGAKQGTILAVGCSATITVIILLFGRHLMGIFTDTPELVDLSYYIMTILATGYLAVAVTQCLSGVMRGAGDTITPMWISLCTTVLFRVPLAYGISFLTRTPELPYGRFECICVSLLCSWIMGMLLNVYFYRKDKWKNKAIG